VRKPITAQKKSIFHRSQLKSNFISTIRRSTTILKTAITFQRSISLPRPSQISLLSFAGLKVKLVIFESQLMPQLSETLTQNALFFPALVRDVCF
jgi:hypothetical protein